MYDLSINDVNLFLNSISGYRVHRQEVGSTTYYQYVNKIGDFYLMKSVVAANVTTFTFARKGNQATANQDIDTAWTNRGSLTYRRFDIEFK